MELLFLVGRWFIDSRLGQIILLSLALLAAVLLTYWTIDSRAYRRGELACESAHMATTAIANQKQARENDRKNRLASTIATQFTEAGEAAAQKTDVTTNETKGVIRNVYRKPPQNKPLVPGSCARPLDERVQERIDQAIDRANSS